MRRDERVEVLAALLAVSAPDPGGTVRDTAAEVGAALSAAPADWWRRAACRGEDPDTFFAEAGHRGHQLIAAAVAMCESCPIRVPCLAYAVAGNEKHGVWGGSTVNDRRRLRRLLAQGAA